MIRKAVVSVIVPIYNISGYLEKCIRSIVGQTYTKLQIILVDDGSTDHSGQICDKYGKDDNRIVVIHKHNEGLVEARKTGLCYAEGEYICYVDGDDWIEADLIEHLLENMLCEDADLVVSDYFCDMKDYVWRVHSQQKAGGYKAEDLIPVMLYTGEFYEFGISQYVWAKLFRKNMLWDIQMQVDSRIFCGEDVAVTYPYILKAHKIYILDYAGYHYLQRMDSMTGCRDASEQMRNRILLEYLQSVFDISVKSDNLSIQLNQYAKNLLLVRQTDYFDLFQRNKILIPYGGIPKDACVVIYGAGKLGQSIYNYLTSHTNIKIVKWVDQNYEMYQKMQIEVCSPEELKIQDSCTYDFILIGISSQKTAEKVEKYLMGIGIRQEKIKWLDKEFVKEENWILGRLL